MFIENKHNLLLNELQYFVCINEWSKMLSTIIIYGLKNYKPL